MAERIPQAVRDAAERIVAELVADERFAAYVANAEIERRIASGDLVPLSRLQMAGGLELTPIGRLGAAEGALRAVQALLDTDPVPLDALRSVIAKTLDAPATATPVPPPATPAPSPPPPPAEPAATPEPEPVVPAESDTPGEDGRPPGMLAPGESTVCTWCKAPIDANTANLAWTRFRKHLCKTHYQEHPNRGNRSSAG
jgi:hypothetical protein